MTIFITFLRFMHRIFILQHICSCITNSTTSRFRAIRQWRAQRARARRTDSRVLHLHLLLLRTLLHHARAARHLRTCASARTSPLFYRKIAVGWWAAVRLAVVVERRNRVLTASDAIGYRAFCTLSHTCGWRATAHVEQRCLRSSRALRWRLRRRHCAGLARAALARADDQRIACYLLYEHPLSFAARFHLFYARIASALWLFSRCLPHMRVNRRTDARRNLANKRRDARCWAICVNRKMYAPAACTLAPAHFRACVHQAGNICIAHLGRSRFATILPTLPTLPFAHRIARRTAPLFLRSCAWIFW